MVVVCLQIEQNAGKSIIFILHLDIANGCDPAIMDPDSASADKLDYFASRNRALWKRRSQRGRGGFELFVLASFVA